MIIRVCPKRFPYATVKILYTRHICPFKFLWEADATAFKLDILPVFDINSVVDGVNLT